MNRIKIIKRANQQVPLEMSEADLRKLDAPGKERQTARAVGNWIDEWRYKDAGRAARFRRFVWASVRDCLILSGANRFEKSKIGQIRIAKANSEIKKAKLRE